MTRLEKLMETMEENHVYIQVHNFPDPDAISSAYGLQKILQYKGVEATICYKGNVERYNTLKLIELLEIQWEHLDDVIEQMKPTDKVLLVDVQKGNSNVADIPAAEIACIDHHPSFQKSEYFFADIRPEYGACASMIAEYFFENQIPMDARTATALSYGIRSDTNGLSRGVCKQDIEMLYRMYDMSDQFMIRKLEKAGLYVRDLEAYAKAIDDVKIVDNVSFASPGKDCPEALIASVADFMLSLIEVDFSVVYAMQQNGIKLSVRSEGDRYDAGKIIHRALRGLGSGGGHATMASGFIPVKDEKQQADDIIRIIKERILKQVRCS